MGKEKVKLVKNCRTCKRLRYDRIFERDVFICGSSHRWFECANECSDNHESEVRCSDICDLWERSALI